MIKALIINLSTATLILFPVLTSGAQPALNPDVNQGTIWQTICLKGYTKTVRPATSYTNGVKYKLMRESGIPQEESSLWALDHIIALTLGGHPRQLSNLQLLTKSENSRKSRIEVKLACFVCSGQMSLSKAQAEIATDWQATYHRYALKKCRR